VQRLTLVLATCVLGCVASPANLWAAQPTPAQAPLIGAQTGGATIEQRLEEIERNIRLIQLHLGFDRQADMTAGLVSGGRLGAIETQTRALNDRIEAIEKILQAPSAQTKTGNPSASLGKFVILNQTGISRYVSVNGMRFYVPPGRTELWIPRGIVEAYLPYWEPPKLLGMSLWRWTGQHYEMSLHIRS